MMRPAVVSSYIPALTPVADDFIAICRNSHRIDDCLKTMINFTTESNLIKILKKRDDCLGLWSKNNITVDLKKMRMRGYRNLEIFLRGWFDEFGFFCGGGCGEGGIKNLFSTGFFKEKVRLLKCIWWKWREGGCQKGIFIPYCTDTTSNNFQDRKLFFRKSIEHMSEVCISDYLWRK